MHVAPRKARLRRMNCSAIAARSPAEPCFCMNCSWAIRRANVGFHGNLIGALASYVDHRRGGAVVDFPAGLGHAVAPVRVFSIHEECLIQQAHFFHDLAAHHQARRRKGPRPAPVLFGRQIVTTLNETGQQRGQRHIAQTRSLDGAVGSHQNADRLRQRVDDRPDRRTGVGARPAQPRYRD